jgi:putative ABC transport system permease protein
MPDSYYDLGYGDVLIAASLIFINGLLSYALQLGLERRLLIAAVRTIVQLLLIGYVLEWIFAERNTPIIWLLALVMSLIAGIAAVQRVEKRYPGIWMIGIVSVMAASWLVTGVALSAVIPTSAWQENAAQYVIPLLGMILGNALTGISLGLNQLTEQLTSHSARVELYLTLGATRWEAARGPVRNAMRTALIPIINSMSVVGLVSLPGMMTGQLLAGVSPLAAVKYQIVIMFLIAAATALAGFGAILASFFRLFTPRHQFQRDRIRSPSGNG